MRDREIDEILKQAAQAPHDVDPALLDRFARSIGRLAHSGPSAAAGMGPGGRAGSDLRGRRRWPARPLLGLHGIQKLSILERALIFPALAILLWLAATASVSEMIPEAGVAWLQGSCWRPAAWRCWPSLRFCFTATRLNASCPKGWPA